MVIFAFYERSKKGRHSLGIVFFSKIHRTNPSLLRGKLSEFNQHDWSGLALEHFLQWNHFVGTSWFQAKINRLPKSKCSFNSSIKNKSCLFIITKFNWIGMNRIRMVIFRMNE